MVVKKHSKVKLVGPQAFKKPNGGTMYVPKDTEVEIVDILPGVHRLIYTVEFEGAHKELSSDHFTV